MVPQRPGTECAVIIESYSRCREPPVPRAISRLPQAPGASPQRVTAQEAAGFEACGWPGQLVVRVAARGGRAAARPRAAG
jgi:hypothetical protein